MARPFEAFAALLVGMGVYAVMQFAYHAANGIPAAWNVELFGLLSFLAGAVAARYLWMPRG